MCLHPWFRTDAKQRFVSVLAAALTIVLTLALTPGRMRAQRATVPANADTSVIVVECRIGEVATRVMQARMRGDTVFLPTAPLLALAGFDSTGHADERSLEAASRLLRAEVVFDPGALVIQFADSGTLPVSRRATRARMRALLRERSAASRAPALSARVPLAPAAVTMSYAVQRDGAFAIDAGSRALGGVLEGGLTRRPDGGMHATFGWTGIPSGAASGAAGGARIRVAALDELSGAAGILVTNVPLVRDDTLRVAPVTLAASAGTELELFEDDVLVAADSIGGAVPPSLRRAQRYGTHVVRLVAHDAAGRAHESRWVESTPDALLSRGTLRYTAAVGRCTHRPCAAMMASVAYAPTDRATFSATMVPPNRDSPHAPTLRGALDAHIGDAAVLSVQRVGAGAAVGSTTTALRFERGAGRSYVLRFGPAGVLPPSPLLPTRAGVGAVGAHLASATGSWSLPAHGVLDLAGALGRSAVALGSSASVPMGAGVIQAGVSASRDAAGACVGWSVGALVNGTWLARAVVRLRSALVRVREEGRSSACGASSRSAIVVLPTGPFSALELAATWSRSRRAPRPELSLALRRRIGRVALARAELSGSDGSYVAHSDVRGAVVLDALRRSVSFGIDPGGATVDGIVYVDDNANGRRDTGEECVPGAVVRADDASAASDAGGIYVLSGLSPDRFARLTVDSLSVDDAGLVPVAPQRVLLTARSVVRVDVALRRRAGGTP